MATEPTPWDTAGTGYSIATSTGDGPYITYINDTWYAVTGFGGTVVNVRSSDSARGPWTTIHTLGTPTGYANHEPITGVHYLGGTYGYVTRYNSSGFPKANTTNYWMNYTTDPSGSWSQYDLTYTSYEFLAGGVVNGEWYLSGYSMTSALSDPWPWVIAHSSDADSGWTAEVGSTTGMTTTTQYRLWEVVYDDNQAKYLRRAYYASSNPFTASGTQTPYRIESASTLGGTWTTHYESTDASTPLGRLTRHSNGVWTVPEFNSSYPDLLYSTDPTTTSWSRTALSFAASSAGRTNIKFGYRTLNVTYGGRFWVISYINSAETASKIAYVKSSNPTGPFTDATTTIGTTTGQSNVIVALTVNSRGDDWVAGVHNTASSGTGRLYALTSALIIRIASFLRQRQSPVRTPSRVRGVNLRARQTPYIT